MKDLWGRGDLGLVVPVVGNVLWGSRSGHIGSTTLRCGKDVGHVEIPTVPCGMHPRPQKRPALHTNWDFSERFV